MLSTVFLFTHQVTTSYWPLLPFILLLFLIATGPLLFATFWHESYKMISVALGLVVAVWYFVMFKQPGVVVENISEYISFITLLFALYVASGGIYVFADKESKASTNIMFLLLGALLANIIGTTGASILLIRPFMRLNRYRLKPYHIVFFIFIVSNCGGLLTPIGDPPLFMGYLKGIPFFFMLQHLIPVWLVCIGLLLLVFYFLEKRNTVLDDIDVSENYSGKLFIEGKRNIIWLVIMLGALFLDPKIWPGLPVIKAYGHHYSYIRELILLLSSFLCFTFRNKKAMEKNAFSFEPIYEVAFLFFGLFLTMIPAISILEQAGSSGIVFSPWMTYLLTGITSAFLDNAPSFLNMLALSMSSQGLSIQLPEAVMLYSQGNQQIYVLSVAVASVFWGGMTYIGNGPNLMIKSIVSHQGLKMPGFIHYIMYYSLPFLLPCILLAGLVLFY